MNTSPSDIQVLVIDDQKTMRSIIRQLLSQVGITNVNTAENGLKGMEVIKDLGIPNPDVIVCDLHMDGMDGMEFVHQLRRAKNATPVLILTGEQDNFLREVAEQAGATKILTKPISAPDLRKEIEIAIGFAN